MKASMKFVFLALAAAGVSAAMTAPASAQVFKPRTCNKSTERDKTLRPDTRCLQAPKEGQAFDRWLESHGDLGMERAKQPLVPGGPLRRDYVPTSGGSGGGGGGSSKGKKPR